MTVVITTRIKTGATERYMFLQTKGASCPCMLDDLSSAIKPQKERGSTKYVLPIRRGPSLQFCFLNLFVYLYKSCIQLNCNRPFRLFAL